MYLLVLFKIRWFSIDILPGGNSNIFGIFTPNLGEDEPNLTSIFFGWVGKHQPGWRFFPAILFCCGTAYQENHLQVWGLYQSTTFGWGLGWIVRVVFFFGFLSEQLVNYCKSKWIKRVKFGRSCGNCLLEFLKLVGEKKMSRLT